MHIGFLYVRAHIYTLATLYRMVCLRLLRRHPPHDSIILQNMQNRVIQEVILLEGKKAVVQWFTQKMTFIRDKVFPALILLLP